MISIIPGRRFRIGRALFLSGLLSSCGRGHNDSIGADLSTADKEYCHPISFPQGWQYPLRDSAGLMYTTPFNEYEFRSGNGPSEFLVAGTFEDRFDPRYTTSKYRIDLSSAQPMVVSIDDATWANPAAKVVPCYRKSVFSNYPQLAASGGVAEFQGKRFAKSGEFWPAVDDYATRLSPDQTWLVLQSRTAPGRGKVFFDVFNVATGTKLLALQGPLRAVWPDGLIGETGWLTERYFVIPTGGSFEGSILRLWSIKSRSNKVMMSRTRNT